MKSALIAQWKGAVPGREAQALELFGEINDYFNKLVANDKVTSFDWYFGTFGPDFFIAKGEREVLMRIQQEPEMMKLIAKSQLVNREFEFGYYFTGGGLEAPMQAFTETLQELAYV